MITVIQLISVVISSCNHLLLHFTNNNYFNKWKRVFQSNMTITTHSYFCCCIDLKNGGIIIGVLGIIGVILSFVATAFTENSNLEISGAGETNLHVIN